MKTLLIITIFFLTLSGLTFKVNTIEVTDVYICTGKHSKRYHFKKNCRGLSNCKGDIKKVYLNEAKHKGRTLCGWED